VSNIKLTEKIILENLMYDLEYMRVMSGFLVSDWFSDNNKIVFLKIKEHFDKYNTPPTEDVLLLAIDNDASLNESVFKDCTNIIQSLTATSQNLNWLTDTTESWGRSQAIYNGVLTTIDIMDKEKKNEKSKRSSDEIPNILSDAISTAIDKSVGHDYIEDADARYESYHNQEDRIMFGLEYFNIITNGGLLRKTLNVILGSTGGGKTLTKCHLAADALTLGYNVLYITLEMSEEKIAERIDANLLDVAVEDIPLIPKSNFKRKIEALKQKKVGKLKIKEYPTANANVNHFRFLLNELKVKQDFIPDIIFVDYINICSSTRIISGQSHNTFVYVKAIAEELRGLGQEFNVPIVTSSQFNRDGMNSSDPSLTNTSESIGLPFTADLMMAVIMTDELKKMGQVRYKQLKNRYNDVANPSSFLVGCDITKFRLYDIKQSLTGGSQQNTKFSGFIV